MMLRPRPQCWRPLIIQHASRRHFAAETARWPTPSPQPVEEVNHNVDIATFRRLAVLDGQPLVFRQLASSTSSSKSNDSPDPLVLPALTKWFHPEDKTHVPSGLLQCFHPYLTHLIRYELIITCGHDGKLSTSSPLATFIRWLLASSDPERQQLCSLLRNELADQLSQSDHPHAGDTMFLSFHAPFALLDAALDFNASRLDPEARLTQLYIAQAALSDLPAELQHDVATPAVLTVPTPSQSTPFPSKTSMENNGNQLVQGDIYTSSIWLGLTPTFTPWHRDPNPNLFCQLRGPKTVRLMPADPGTEVYSSVKSWVKARYIELRQALGGIPVSAGGVESPVPVLTNPAIRGIEMMQGVEKRVWEGVIWGEDAMSNGDDEEMLGPELEEATKLLGKLTKAKRLIEKHLVEAALMPGDVLYIPLGWWHSVRSGLPPVRRQAKQKDDDASSASGQEQQPGDLNASVNWWFRWRVSRQREW